MNSIFPASKIRQLFCLPDIFLHSLKVSIMFKGIMLLSAVLLSSMAMYSQNNIVLHTATAKDTISKNIYGHFAEDLGRCIYGGFYVGDNKNIANENGVRLDIIDALKKLKIPVLRWPGGCYADHYHWKDGVGPKAQRPSMLNVWW